MTKNKVGRPSKYDPSWMLDKVTELMAEGASKMEVATNLMITYETLNEWENDPDKPEFSYAIKMGEQLSQTWWEKIGRTSLCTPQFSYTGWYMNMKNRFGWADKQEVKQQTITRDISDKPLTEDEWQEEHGN